MSPGDTRDVYVVLLLPFDRPRYPELEHVAQTMNPRAEPHDIRAHVSGRAVANVPCEAVAAADLGRIPPLLARQLEAYAYRCSVEAVDEGEYEFWARVEYVDFGWAQMTPSLKPAYSPIPMRPASVPFTVQVAAGAAKWLQPSVLCQNTSQPGRWLDVRSPAPRTDSAMG